MNLFVSSETIFVCWTFLASRYPFGILCESDILLNYPNNALFITILRICLSVALAWSYPLNLDPTRKSVCSLIFNKDINNITNMQFYMITYIIWFISFIIAIFVTNLGLIFGLCGATAGVILSYILPGLFYYYSFKNIKNDNSNYIACLFIVIGIILFFFATIIQFL